MATPPLAELVDPAHTAVVTSEVQNEVVGAHSALPALAEAARPMVGRIAVLCAAARHAGAQVIHATAARRADGAGSNTVGPSAQSVRGPHPSDVVLSRLHGLNPMAGTELDPVLRNLGVTTIVVTGVSVNIAVTNLVMDAINVGYQVVLPRDGVCGLPESYGDAVIDHTLGLLATITTVDEIVAAWGGSLVDGGAQVVP